jgi:hypothetical protein
VVAFDWLDLTADQIFEKIKHRIKPGNIILLHDSLYKASSSHLLDRLSMLTVVDRLLFEFSNFEFVTVPELLRRGQVVRKLWIQPGDADFLSKQKTWDTPKKL